MDRYQPDVGGKGLGQNQPDITSMGPIPIKSDTASIRALIAKR